MEMSKEVYEINLKDIKVGKFNVRLTDQKAEIDDLKESIKKYGLLQPVVLRGSHGKPPYELIIGQRRFRAHKELGKDTIRAVFCGEVDDIQAKILSLTENMHRVELNHADKAEAITSLYIHYGRNNQRVAQELGLSPITVRDYIRIEEQATPKAKGLLRERKIKKQDVKRVIDAAQGDPAKADVMLDVIPKLSKYEKDRAVEYGKSHPKASVNEIIEESKKSKFQPTVILNLTPEVDEALNKAEKKLLMDRESIAAKALSEWLKNNGFLKPRLNEIS